MQYAPAVHPQQIVPLSRQSQENKTPDPQPHYHKLVLTVQKTYF